MMSRRDGGAALLGAPRGRSASARRRWPGSLLGAPPGRRARPGQGAGPAARDVARVDGRRDHARAVRARERRGLVRARLLAACGGRRGRSAGGRAASRAPALARPRARRDPTRCAPLFWGAEAVFALAFAAMALLVAYSPDVWNTEKPMDMAFLNAAQPRPDVPARGPVAGGRGRQLLLPRPPRARRCRSSSPRWPPTAATTSPSRRSSGSPRAAVFTLGATLWAAIRGEEGARRAGVGAVVLVLVLGNLDGARQLWRPARAIRLVRPSRGWCRTRSPSSPGSRSSSATCTRTCSRCRSRCWRSRSRCRSCWAARVRRGADAAGAAARAVGVLYAVNAWSYPVMAGCSRWPRWLRDPRSALGWLAVGHSLLSVLALACCCAPVPPALRPGGRGDRAGRTATRTVARRPGAVVRLARALRRPRVRGPRVGDRGRPCVCGGSPWPRWRYAARGGCRRAPCPRGGAACGLPRAGAAARRLAARGRRRWRACSAPSCCTCATSSTAVRCTA